jgi:holo-[acyl-carrier protein] synthase
VGTDIVDVRSVEESIARFGDRYISRVYTRDEAAYCANPKGHAASRFAARFAAKEAALKVLRLANDDVFDWRSIEVVRKPASGDGLLRSAVRRRGEASLRGKP